MTKKTMMILLGVVVAASLIIMGFAIYFMAMFFDILDILKGSPGEFYVIGAVFSTITMILSLITAIVCGFIFARFFKVDEKILEQTISERRKSVADEKKKRKIISLENKLNQVKKDDN